MLLIFLRKLHLLLFVCLISFCLSTESYAQKRRGKKDPGQRAQITVDGSAIYKDPNFDAPVMEYLDRGTKILISKRVYRGIGGLGAFYKVRLRPRVYGYVTDVDIEILGDIKRPSQEQKQEENKPDENNIPGDPTQIQEDLMTDEITEEGPQGEGIYYTRYTGVTYQSVNYKEKLNNQEKSASWGLIGFKMSGPGNLMGGMPLDIEVLVATGAPSFYDDISSSTSGYAFLAHMMPMFPLVEKSRYVLYYSFGPMVRYSAFKVKVQASAPDVDSQELAIGVKLGAGLGLLITPKWALRLDTNYTKEEESYTAFGLSLQYKY